MASDASVCRECGEIGPRDRLQAIGEAGGFDAFRCPDCTTRVAEGPP